MASIRAGPKVVCYQIVTLNSYLIFVRLDI